MARDPVERFLRFVDRSGDCWLWTGWTAGTKSTYGYFNPGTRANDPHVLAHRYSYMVYIGEIPDGYQIDHLCRQPLCVNPDHLEAVTPAENCRRTRITVCSKGLHDLTDPVNVREDWAKVGHRLCWPCRQEYERQRWQRRKAAMKEAQSGV